MEGMCGVVLFLCIRSPNKTVISVHQLQNTGKHPTTCVFASGHVKADNYTYLIGWHVGILQCRKWG